MKKAVTCAQCGTKMRAGIKFCSKCGYTLRDAEAEAIAAAAQAEEAAANFLSEEEIAAMTAKEEAPVQEIPSAPEIKEVAPSLEAQRFIDAGQKAVSMQSEASAVSVAKNRARNDLKVARVEGNSAVRRGAAEDAARLDAARLDKVSAKAEAKAIKKRSASAEKLSSIRIGEDKKAAKRLAAAERKNLRTTIDINAQDAARLARAEKRDLATRAFGSRVEDLRQDGEHALLKKREKEIVRAERAEIAGRDTAFRDEAKATRARTKALRSAERKAEKYRQEEENAVVREKTAENRLHESRLASEKAIFKQRATAEEKLQALKQSDELKVAKRNAAERRKATKALLREEGKISDREHDELRKTAEEKAFDNRLYSKQTAAERKMLKRRHSDIQRTAAKQAAVDARETKRLGNIEYKAAVSGLSDEAAETRRLASAASLDLQRRRQEEKLAKKGDAADAKLLRQTGAADDRLQSMKISDSKKNAKRVAAERKKATKALLREESKLSRRGNDEIRQNAEEKAFENRLYAKQTAADRKTRKRRQSDVQRVAAKQASIRERETKRLGSIEYKAAATGLLGEAADARRLANAAALDMKRRREEEKLIKKSDVAERKLLRQTSAADDRLQTLKINDTKKNAKRLAKDRYKATKVLLREEAKISGRENDEIRKDAKEKEFDNRLYAKQTAAEKKNRKRRQSDVQRVAAKRAAVRERETKRLGSVEYKAAVATLNAEAAEARRQADAATIDLQRRRAEEKLAAKELESEKRLVSLRAGDKKKASRIKINQRAKETRNLSRAELRALRATQVEEAKEVRRQADEIKLNTQQKIHEDRLYAKKLAADRRLIKSRAADTDKIQRENIRADQRRQSAQRMEESRDSRIRTDVTKREIRDQKNQDQLYKHQKASSDELAKRAHRLELKQLRDTTARDKRVIVQKEREQRKSLALASRTEKEALKRAKKIARVSGVPVSLVPAIANEGGPAAPLTTNAAGAPALHEPDALLSTAYTTKREQYEAFSQRKKKDKKALRYVEIGVRNDAKYFSTIYQNGEVMVAKRTVYIARIQAILAILLMIVALVGSLLPAYTVMPVEPTDPFYEEVLDGYMTEEPGAAISFESILAEQQSDFSNPIQYLTGLTSIFNKIDIMDVLKAVKTAMNESSLLSNFGRWAVLLVLSVAILLTPIVILLNLIIAILRVIFSIGGRSVRLTRVMKNLRASYTFLGILLLPMLFMPSVPDTMNPSKMVSGVKMEIGLVLMLASFGAAVILNFILNLIKKYERSDRKYVTAVTLGGLARLALLAVFLFMMSNSGVLSVAYFGAGVKKYIGYGLLSVSFAFLALCSRAISTLGFEVLGYTKGHNVNHWPLFFTGIISGLCAFLPTFIGAKLASRTAVILALVVMLAFGFITLVINLVKRIIIKRGCLIDPILDALDEGYPLK